MSDNVLTPKEQKSADEGAADFIRLLRGEVIHHKEQRVNFVLKKLAFVIGLFGLGSIGTTAFELYGLLYAIPFVALAYDVYISAEDYKVKRVGQFIRMSEYGSQVERAWERFVNNGREPLAVYASLGLTVIAMLASSIVIMTKALNPFFVGWLVVSAALTVFVFLYYWLLKRRLKNQSKNWLKDDAA